MSLRLGSSAEMVFIYNTAWDIQLSVLFVSFLQMKDLLFKFISSSTLLIYVSVSLLNYETCTCQRIRNWGLVDVCAINNLSFFWLGSCPGYRTTSNWSDSCKSPLLLYHAVNLKSRTYYQSKLLPITFHLCCSSRFSLVFYCRNNTQRKIASNGQNRLLLLLTEHTTKIL